MTSTQDLLTLELQVAFEKLNIPKEKAIVTVSNRPELCDYQCNGALSAAKILKKSPLVIAQTLKDNLDIKGIRVEVAAPGFLNFTLEKDFLSQALTPLLEDERLGCPKVSHPRNVFIDYGGMNVAKPMHVGHLRSSITGECLKRLYRFMGHAVTGDIHLGDWGTQMGMLIYALSEKFPELPYFDENAQGPYPTESPVTLDDLQVLYPEISARCKVEPETREKTRAAITALQKGRPGYRALWQHFVDISVQDMKKHLDRLDVTFEQWFGESRYHARLNDLVEELQARGVTQKSEGAIIIPVDKNEDEMPPLLLQKSDGGFLYATTDLATIEERLNTFKADEILYIVDARQSLHFNQVFRAAHKAGYKGDFYHLGYGTINGPDGKPFKTRDGGAMRLEDLINLLVEEARIRIDEAGLAKELPPQKQSEIAEMIGIAALKFGDLQHDLGQNYRFDIKKFSGFEGRTGPYLLYAAVRIKSILEKATQQKLNTSPIQIEQNEEKALALKLLQFSEVIQRAYQKRAPHVLCEFVFNLSQTFSRFYQHCHILREENSALRGSRLSLCILTLKQIELILDLLGIKIPERM